MDKLAFFICCAPGFGKRVIPRRNSTDTLTDLHKFLGVQAYKCQDYEEFRWASQRVGKKEPFYSEVLIERPDGSYRFPNADDRVAPLSPVVAVASAASADGLVAQSSSTTTGGTIQPTLLARIRVAVSTSKDNRSRADILAKELGSTKDEIKAAVTAPGSGMILRPPFGWVEFEPEEALLA